MPEPEVRDDWDPRAPEPLAHQLAARDALRARRPGPVVHAARAAYPASGFAEPVVELR